MPEPLFLFGVCQRTGTNFLSALLSLHSECIPIGSSGSVEASQPEDYLLDTADHLTDYARAVREKWHPSWKFDDAAEQLLLRELVDALGRFVIRLPEIHGAANDMPDVRYVVTKSPMTGNLELLTVARPKLLKLVIVRDPRDVAESGVRGFGSSHERWMRMWRVGVDQLRAALDVDQTGSIHLVRYEELVHNPKRELESIFNFLQLSSEDFDWEAAENMPLLGSSFERGASQRLHWAPTADSREIAGTTRWADWPAARHARLEHIAGEQMRFLGYDPLPARGFTLRNSVLDLVWSRARSARRMRGRLQATTLDPDMLRRRWL